MTWVLDSTRIKQTFLRPTSDYGTSVPHLATGFRRFCVTAVWGFLFLAAFAAEAAFTPAPKESVKALKIAKGKPINRGLVFIEGKYIEPPYVVERYGNVIRINKIQVTHPVIDWAEFLKTQSGAVVSKTESAPAAAPAESAPAPEPAKPAPAASSSSDDDDPLADLFDDAPVKKPAAKKTASRPAAPKAAPKPKVTTTVSFDGEFELNDRATALLTKINATRTDIDASLRRGSFICFGSSYSRILGDMGAAGKILEKVPEIMKQNSEFDDFYSAMRKAGFVYFPNVLIKEFFRNRVDYLALQKRWKKYLEDKRYNEMLEKAGVTEY